MDDLLWQPLAGEAKGRRVELILRLMESFYLFCQLTDTHMHNMFNIIPAKHKHFSFVIVSLLVW